MTIKKKKKKKLMTNNNDRDRMSCICVIYFCWLPLALWMIFNLMNDLSTTIQASIELASLPDRKIRRHSYCTTHIEEFARIDAIDQVNANTYIAKKKKNFFLSSLYNDIYTCIYTCMSLRSLSFWCLLKCQFLFFIINSSTKMNSFFRL